MFQVLCGKVANSLLWFIVNMMVITYTRVLQQPISDGDLVPPLELAIKTKLVASLMLFYMHHLLSFIKISGGRWQKLIGITLNPFFDNDYCKCTLYNNTCT